VDSNQTKIVIKGLTVAAYLLAKALAPGTIRQRKDGPYKKESNGNWVKVKENKSDSKEKPQEQAFNKKDVLNSLKKRGISGDNLLDQEDKIDELVDVGANIDNQGNITLYHRTSTDIANKIKATGKMSGKEDNLFFSTTPKGQAEGFGEGLVVMKIPIEKIAIDDIFGDEAHISYSVKPNTITDMSKYLTNKAKT
jgi:hypothetical protein